MYLMNTYYMWQVQVIVGKGKDKVSAHLELTFNGERDQKTCVIRE